MNNTDSKQEVRPSDLFLLSAAQMAQGDVAKQLSIPSIVKAVNSANVNDHNAKIILKELNEKGYVKLNHDSSFSVTYLGISYISLKLAYPIESLGILAEKDMQILVDRFNNWIYRESLDSSNKISIDRIVTEFKGVVGINPIIQLIHILENKGVLERIDSDHVKLVT